MVSNFSEHDGSARVAEIQAEELANEGNYVAIFALGANIKPKKADLFTMGMPKSLFWERIYRLIFPLDLFKTLKWLPRLKEFDQVIVHLYPLTWLGYLAKRLYKIKYIFWYHGIMDPQFFPWFYERLYLRLQIFLTRLTVKNVDYAVAVSKYGQKELKKYTGLDSKVIYNKVDLSKFHPGVNGTKIREKYNLGNDPVILFVGALRPAKGVDLLIQAFNLIKMKIPNSKLLIVGSPDYPYYFKRLTEIGKDGVVFTGFVSHHELPEYYAACDVYASCSLQENHNLAVVEAKASGKPVVTFDIDSFKEQAMTNHTLVPIKDIERFAEACIDKLNQMRGV